MPIATVAQVCEAIGRLLGAPAHRVTAEAALADLATDSFALIEMAIDVQEEYGVVFHQADLKAVRTVGALAARVAARQAGP
ncbi:MAG: acyl carrier protein [Acidimicrobiales bacterium]